MPVKVLGRGTVVPRGGLQEAEAEAHAARAALASARIDATAVDTVVAPSRDLAAKVATMIGVPGASVVGCSEQNKPTIEVAAALIENTPGRVVLAVEGIAGDRAASELRGAVAALLTKAQPGVPVSTKITVQPADDDDEEPVMSWRPTPPGSQER